MAEVDVTQLRSELQFAAPDLKNLTCQDLKGIGCHVSQHITRRVTLSHSLYRIEMGYKKEGVPGAVYSRSIFVRPIRRTDGPNRKTTGRSECGEEEWSKQRYSD